MPCWSTYTASSNRAMGYGGPKRVSRSRRHHTLIPRAVGTSTVAAES